MEDINRIKVVLAEKKRTNRWLAEELGKDPATVSKWCIAKKLVGQCYFYDCPYRLFAYIFVILYKN